jgi:hypothetical protein
MRLRYGILGLVLVLSLGAQGGGCNNHVVGVQDYGSVTGRVIDARTNKPIAGALVSVGSLYTANADSQGAFTIGQVPVGEQRVMARSAGYVTAAVTVDVTKDATASADYLKLAPVSGMEAGPAPPPTPSPTPTPFVWWSTSPSPLPSST